MSFRFTGFARSGLALSALAFCALAAGMSAWPLAAPQAAEDSMTMERPMLLLPLLDPERGRRLFVSKGCVLCHSVNGVGGRAAPALDAPEGQFAIDPLDFVVRMWRGASAMIELQSIELGYQIHFTADELADLAAFAASRADQADFSAADIPEPMRYWTLDEPYWEGSEWPEDLLEREPPWQ